MNDTKTMLVAIINGQSAMKQELLEKINGVEDRLTEKFEKLDLKIDKVDKKLTKRIDKIGTQLSYLEDDTPTNKEFRSLVKRVNKIEHKLALEL